MQMRTVAETHIKEMPCSVCGTPLTVGKNTRKQPRCFECGLKQAIQSQKEMTQKSGPTWDKYVAAMRNKWGM